MGLDRLEIESGRPDSSAAQASNSRGNSRGFQLISRQNEIQTFPESYAVDLFDDDFGSGFEDNDGELPSSAYDITFFDIETILRTPSPNR